MSDYSYQIEKLSRNLDQFMGSPNFYEFSEIANWVDQQFFKDNFIQQNLALNFLWIFSKQRILRQDNEVQAICSWLYENIKPRLHSRAYSTITAFTIVALEKLIFKLNEFPSIRSCLTNTERQKVKDRILDLDVDDRILSFTDSFQYQQLKKLIYIPVVSSFLAHYDELLEIATGQEEIGSLDQILQYILTINDVISDEDGVLGLVDDLYALEQLSINFASEDLIGIKWKFEMEHPDFQYPILIDDEGNNLINRADSLIKAALYHSEDNDLKHKALFINEPGPLGILSSILGSIIDLKIEKETYQVSNVSKLVVGETYELIKGPDRIFVKFSKIISYGDDSFYMFETNGNTIQISTSVINKCTLMPSDSELTSQNKVEKFIEHADYNIHGMFPFGLANNLNINFKKVFLVDRKNKLENYLDTNIEGKSIRDWFGVRLINTKLEEKYSHGLLSNDPLITATYSLKSLIGYLAKNSFNEGEFHSLNIILDTNIDNNIEYLHYLSSAYSNPFKTVNIFTNQKSSYAKDQFNTLGFLLFEERGALKQKFVHPPKDSLFENYLSKLGSYPEISFIELNDILLNEFYELLNITLDKEYIKLRRYLFLIRRKMLSRYSQLTSNGKAFFLQELETYINKLHSYTHVHKNISKIIEFVEINKEYLINLEKFNFLSGKSFNESTIFLVTKKELARLKKKGWEKNHASMLSIKDISQLKHLVVPAFTSLKEIKELIHFPYAEKISFVATNFEIDNFLKPLLDKRDLIKEKRIKNIDEAIQSKTEFEDLFLDLDYDFSKLSQSIDRDEADVQESRVFIFENSEYLALPLGGRVICTNELVNIIPERLPVNSIEEGMFLIRPLTNQGDLQDSILDKTYSNIENIREKAFLWKSMLREAFNSNSKSIESLLEFLKSNNQPKHIVTVKNWFKSPTLIAPDNPEIIFGLFAEYLGLSNHFFDESLAAVNTLYKARNAVLKDLPEYLKNSDFDDQTNVLAFQIQNKSFEANIYEVLTYQDTGVSFENLYKVKDLDEYE